MNNFSFFVVFNDVHCSLFHFQFLSVYNIINRLDILYNFVPLLPASIGRSHQAQN